MAEKVTIPISFFEYTGEYTRPLLGALMERARIVQAVFDALAPWGLEIDNVDPITTGKASEQGVNFRLPGKRCAFFFGASLCRLTKDDANWATAEELIAILTAALQSLRRASGAEISKQKTSLALHLQPRSMSFLEILRPFLSSRLMELDTSGIRTGASIVKWESRKVTLDGSGALANAVFLRLERDFGSEETFEEIAVQIRDDEIAIFNMLNVEEEP